jgi:predicted PurR-regulated permease PerM
VPESETNPVQITSMALGIVAFHYFAQPIIVPIFLARVAAMTLKPLIRWLSFRRIPPCVSSAVVLCLLVSGVSAGFFQLIYCSGTFLAGICDGLETMSAMGELLSQ